MIKVAIIGTQGVPANYGGFESFVENILGENCQPGVEYTVFCSSKDLPTSLPEYKGAKLKYIGLRANGIQSVAYDILSMCHAVTGYDTILILGVSGCLFLPMLKMMTRSKVIVNIDGIEHRRAKWGKAAKWLLRTSEAMAVKHADLIITDNKGIQDYVTETYGKKSTMIAYGGDQVKRNISEEEMIHILDNYGLKKNEYAITVCRIEPENNSHVILEAFSKNKRQLIFIGNWNCSEWAKKLKAKYELFPNIKIFDAIYDLDTLYTLRSNAGVYIHGHSAGGTNPSLVEAMHFGIPILAFDVIYNRETTGGKAYYFKDEAELEVLMDRKDLDGSKMKEIAEKQYTWKYISEQYCNLYK